MAGAAPWWRGVSISQVCVRSFCDGDGQGILPVLLPRLSLGTGQSDSACSSAVSAARRGSITQTWRPGRVVTPSKAA